MHCFRFSDSNNCNIEQAGLPLVQQYLFQFDNLVKEQIPKLGAHFTKEMISPSMYASQWFITVFTYSFPFHLAIRIWDVFLYEVCALILCVYLPSFLTSSVFIKIFLGQGVKIVFKVGLALLKCCQDSLVSAAIFSVSSNSL